MAQLPLGERTAGSPREPLQQASSRVWFSAFRSRYAGSIGTATSRSTSSGSAGFDREVGPLLSCAGPFLQPGAAIGTAQAASGLTSSTAESGSDPRRRECWLRRRARALLRRGRRRIGVAEPDRRWEPHCGSSQAATPTGQSGFHSPRATRGSALLIWTAQHCSAADQTPRRTAFQRCPGSQIRRWLAASLNGGERLDESWVVRDSPGVRRSQREGDPDGASTRPGKTGACLGRGASPERPVQAGESAQESAVAALDVLAVPEIAYLLLAAGLLCLIVRLADPDLGWFSGAVGSALLLLAGAGLLAMPVRPAGVLMLTFAATSLCMEVLVLPGFGLYAAGAAFSLVLAGAFLCPDPMSVHPAVVVAIAGTVTVVTYRAGRRSWRYVRDRPFNPSPRTGRPRHHGAHGLGPQWVWRGVGTSLGLARGVRRPARLGRPCASPKRARPRSSSDQHPAYASPNAAVVASRAARYPTRDGPRVECRWGGGRRHPRPEGPDGRSADPRSGYAIAPSSSQGGCSPGRRTGQPRRRVGDYRCQAVRNLLSFVS